ncbi:MAG: ribose-phosphate diphosphokinase [Deltaproteobacteria bacterium]
MQNTKIFSGTSNVPLADAVCKYLGVQRGKAEIERFSDGEFRVDVSESVRGSSVFVIQSTCPPVNENIMELLIITDAMKRASAASITAVIPYYGYARQDRKAQPRAPITAKLVADIIAKAGVNRVITVDLHAGQIQGFFDVPVDHLFALPVLNSYIRSNYSKEELVVVSPDAGGMERAGEYAKRLDVPIAVAYKKRTEPNVAKITHVIGDVEGKTAVLIDDMVDTAGTAVQAAEAIYKEGARRVVLCSTHGVLSGNAVERIRNSVLEEVIITDTVPPREETLCCSKIKVLTISELLGEAIRRIVFGKPINTLFS